MKRKRRLLLPSDVEAKSKRIFDNLLFHTDILKYERICTYVSSFSEPDTFFLIKYLLENEKKVYVPITDKENVTISICEISDTDFKKGAYSIPEPKIDNIVSYDTPEFIIVPGIAFDKSGARVGFGMGYYDKFLSGTNAEKVALCYDFQVTDKIDSEKHDIFMDKIITDKNVY